MNKEARLDIRIENPDLLVMAGSRLYGTDTPTSDHDYRGFCIPPLEYIVGLNNFESKVIRCPDTVIYSITKFFQLLIKGDPIIYETLFVPERNIINRTEFGGTLLRNKSLFACKIFARRMIGYAESEWRKVTGVQLSPVVRIPTEDSIVEDIRQVFLPDKETMDHVLSILFANHPKIIKPATGKLGEKRKAQIENYGYCTSSASHTIRLLEQLKELMDTGRMTFPRPNAEYLLAIKIGKVPFVDVEKKYIECLADAQDAESGTELPPKPPINKIHKLYNEIISCALKEDQWLSKYYSDYANSWRSF